MENNPRQYSVPLFFLPKIIFLLVVLIITLVLSSCSAASNYDIRGDWAYTMLTNDDHTYDMGTIKFSGAHAKGTYLQNNFSQVE